MVSVGGSRVRVCSPTVFETGGGWGRLWLKKCGWPLGSGRGREMGSRLVPPERTAVLLAQLSPVRPLLDFSASQLQGNTFVWFKATAFVVIY